MDLLEDKRLEKVSSRGQIAKIPSNSNFKSCDDVASFCVLKLEQLNLFDDNNKIIDEEDKVGSNFPLNFGQKLFNFMEV